MKSLLILATVSCFLIQPIQAQTSGKKPEPGTKNLIERILFLVSPLRQDNFENFKDSQSKVSLFAQTNPKTKTNPLKIFDLEETLPHLPPVLAKDLYILREKFILALLESERGRRSQSTSSLFFDILLRVKAVAQAGGTDALGPVCFNAGWIAKPTDLDIPDCKGTRGDFDPTRTDEAMASFGISEGDRDRFKDWAAQCGEGEVPCHPMVGGWGPGGSPVCSPNSTPDCFNQLDGNPEVLRQIKNFTEACIQTSESERDRSMITNGAPNFFRCSVVIEKLKMTKAVIQSQCSQQGSVHARVCQTFSDQAQKMVLKAYGNKPEDVPCQLQVVEQEGCRSLIGPDEATRALSEAEAAQPAPVAPTNRQPVQPFVEDFSKPSCAGVFANHLDSLDLPRKVDQHWVQLLTEAAASCDKPVYEVFNHMGFCLQDELNNDLFSNFKRDYDAARSGHSPQPPELNQLFCATRMDLPHHRDLWMRAGNTALKGGHSPTIKFYQWRYMRIGTPRTLFETLNSCLKEDIGKMRYVKNSSNQDIIERFGPENEVKPGGRVQCSPRTDSSPSADGKVVQFYYNPKTGQCSQFGKPEYETRYVHCTTLLPTPRGDTHSGSRQSGGTQ